MRHLLPRWPGEYAQLLSAAQHLLHVQVARQLDAVAQDAVKVQVVIHDLAPVQAQDPRAHVDVEGGDTWPDQSASHSLMTCNACINPHKAQQASADHLPALAI